MVFEKFIYFMSKIFIFSSYINTASGFPKPLSQVEEKQYFKLFKEGDQLAKEKLISHNLRLVAHIVKKYSGAGEADDLLSVGSIGLIKAINTFEYDKGTQLSTYAARCIENEILMLIRMNKKHRAVISMSEALSHDKDGNEMEYLEIIADDHDYYQDVENSIITKQLINIIDEKLSKREGEIIRHRYGLDGVPALTQREVANKLGISRSYISRLEAKSLAYLRQELYRQPSDKVSE